MSNNNYSALNDKEFEELSRDLLAKREGIFFESFKKGKDRGTDLRHSSDGTEHTIIVQAKHFIKSGLTKLLYQLRTEELDKVKALKPNRYILTTTVSLNESDKEKIRQIFSGYIHNTNDIIGQDDLDALLIAHPEIMKSHHKLYITNLAILNEIINNHITSRSLSYIKEIQKSIHLYVTNKKYEEAVAILNKEHFLIITGEPGIGKTSLANYITHQHLADGFTFVYILSDITDAEKMLDDDAKQLFYFDDFLGANYLKVRQHPNQDSAIMNFIQRIKSLKNKRLILTTRTTILNQAKADFERLKAPHLDIAQHEITIKDYEPFDKALILYNHLYHSNIPLPLLQNLIETRSYFKVIEHQNYSPRIIEYITDISRFPDLKPAEFSNYILNKLDHPEDIWKEPFESQITEAAKFLLQTMFTLPTGTNEQLVLKAFNERIRFEVANNGFSKGSNLFVRTLQELLGGFIHRHLSNTGIFLQFYNPSFADFMSMHLQNNVDEIQRILNGNIYNVQFTNSFIIAQGRSAVSLPQLPEVLIEDLFIGIFDPNFVPRRGLEKVPVPRKLLLDTVLAKIDDLQSFNSDRNRELVIFAFLINTFKISEVENALLNLYPFIDFELIPVTQFEDLFKVTDIFIDKETKIYQLAINDWEKIAMELFKKVDYADDFVRIKDLFYDFDFSYEEFHKKYKDQLQSILDTFFNSQYIKNKVDDLDLSSVYEKEKMLDILSEYETEVRSINSVLALDDSPGFAAIHNWDYEEVIEENIKDRDRSVEYQAPIITKDKNVLSKEELNEKVEDIFDGILKAKE